MRKAWWYISGGAVVFIIGGSLFAAEMGAFQAPEATPRGEEYWIQRIEQLGSADAFVEFKAHNERVPSGKRHEGAHEFGGALFTAQGLAGVTSCTSDFANGCYHEFFGRAVASHGLGIVEKMANHCATKDSRRHVLSCEHGIGHGLVTFLGYDVEGVLESLEACAELDSTDPVRGCSAGVFMEFNFRDALAGEAPPRSYDGDMVYPCQAVPPDEQDACYFWQAQWWRQVPFGELPPREAFTQIAGRCRDLDELPLRQACFAGLGNFLGPEVAFDLTDAAQMCDAVTQITEETLYCRMRVLRGALSIRANIPAYERTAICGGLRPDARAFCQRYISGEKPTTLKNTKTGETANVSYELFIGPKE